MRTCGLLGALLASASIFLVAAEDPSPDEMLLIYDINRARNSPTRYQQEFSLTVDLSGVTPRPPLALNTSLVASSGFHAQEMANNDYFGHQSAVTGDWPNKMALDQGYPLPAFYPSTTNNIESIAAGYADVQAALKGLIEDLNTPSLGHRIQLLAMSAFFQTHREVGAGFASKAGSTYTTYYSIHTAVRDTGGTFLTGVVYRDANSNSRYDLNEGLGGVTVSTGSLTATSNSTGGWTIPITDGAYTLTASGGTFTGTATSSVTVSGNNVEVDFVSGKSSGSVDFAAIPGGGGGGGGGSGNSADTDGDGFQDDLEAGYGTSSSDAAQTPFGGAPAGTPLGLTLTKLAIKLGFKPETPANDSASVSGTLPVAQGFDPLNKEVTVFVGGIVKKFILDVKGKSPKEQVDKFKLALKRKDGVVQLNGAAKFQAKYAKGNYKASLVDEQLLDADVSPAAGRTVRTIVLFASALYQADRGVMYKAKAGKTGAVKLVPLQ